MIERPQISFYVSLAGCGNPWPVLTQRRLRMLCLLQIGATFDDIISDPGIEMDQDEVGLALAELKASSLLTETGNAMRPTASACCPALTA